MSAILGAPWRWDGDDFVIRDADGDVIAETFGSEVEMSRLGLLFTASPLLLAASEDALQVLLVAVRVGAPGCDPEKHVTVKRLRAAIAAAKGGA